MLKKNNKSKKKKLVIITKGKDVAEFYKKQIESLFEDHLDIKTYNTATYNEKNEALKNNESVETADLYLITTDAFSSKKERESKIGKNSDCIELRVDLTEDNISELLELPEGTEAMLVNMSSVMAKEVISRLSQLGINHIKFVPVYPEIETYPNLDIAVTPGEHRFVPPGVGRIIDIGHRSIDIETIVELALKLNKEGLLETQSFTRYFEKMANKNYSIDRLYGKSRRLESQFERLLSALDDGIIGIDEDRRIFAINEKALSIIGCDKDYVREKKVKDIIPEINEYLENILKSYDKTSINRENKRDTKVIKLNSSNINTSVFPIYKNERNIGTFIKLNRFLEEETRQQGARMQLLTKGHCAKYKFSDIIGNSNAMKEAVSIAEKMAVTSAPIMIEGESGTGKELFAHAIHNSSQRRSKPFIALNCAAMPDNLLESELFGHEEGAFTGAKKGGKLGLFEFAHTGTLFLDEIEAMSSALQVKLLRVLQEREVMRLGGHRIISVDVRIIAATNRNIEDMVSKGDFRKDLYYRLNTIQIEIPPLRDRKEDISLLIESMKNKIGGKYKIAGEVMKFFEQYAWEGNARELQNYIEYFTYLDKELIEMGDLPPNLKKKINAGFLEKFSHDHVFSKMGCSKTGKNGLKNGNSSTIKSYLEEEKVLFVIEEIKIASQNKKGIGRRAISKNAEIKGLKLSEQEVRTIMDKLENMGIIKKNLGRSGSELVIK